MPTEKPRNRLLLIIPAILLVGGGIWFGLHQYSPKTSIRHVVLISLDTCRADYLSCYGHPKAITPHIDALAAKGWLFSNAMTPIPLTLPAHASMLTGTIPPRHGKHQNTDVHFDPSLATLAALLRAKGYRTGGFVGSKVLNRRLGLDRGFDIYNDQFKGRGRSEIRSERRAEEVNRPAFEWLEKQKDNQVFLFLHYYDPHDAYEPPEPFATTFREDPYAGEIAYTDHCIGQVIARLKQLGMYESSLIIVTADHGEMLGEHGESTHMYFVYQSAMRVPMVFKLPGSDAAKKIDAIASIIDIVPTVCDLMGIDPPAGSQGKSLASRFSDAPSPEDRYLYCESLYSTKYGANSLLGLIGKRWKYIQTTRPELYDLQKDPGEQTNLAKAEPHQARILKDRLAQLLEQTVRRRTGQRDKPLDARALKHLRSLGYVAGTDVVKDFSFDQSKEDPKDLIGFHDDYRKAMNLADQNRLAEARALLESLLKQRRGYHGLVELASLTALKQKDYRSAIRYGEKAVAIEPDHFKVHHVLGIAYSQCGQQETAVKQFELALKCLKKDPYAAGPSEHAKIMNALATVLVSYPNRVFTDPSRALELARQACTLTRSKNPRYLNTMAIAYAALDNFNKAITIAEKALALARARGDQSLATRIQGQLGNIKKAREESE